MLLLTGVVVIAALVAATVGPARLAWLGGPSASAVSGPPPRSWPLPAILAVLAGCILVVTGDQVAGGTGVDLLVAGLAVAALGCVSAAAGRPGLILLATGLAANLTVVAVDSGMPVRDAPAGQSAGPHHHGVSHLDQLTALSDDIRFGPEMLSPGDVAVALGCGLFIYSAVFRRRPGRPRPSRHPGPFDPTDRTGPTGPTGPSGPTGALGGSGPSPAIDLRDARSDPALPTSSLG